VDSGTLRSTFVPNYDESLVHPILLPPLLAPPGVDACATDASDFHWRVRPAILDSLGRHLYGALPPPLMVTSATCIESGEMGPEGFVIREQWDLAWSAPNSTPEARLLLFRPKIANGPVPCFLVPSTAGNRAVSDALEILPSRGYIHPRTRSGPGAQEDRWPIERILRAGFAVATFGVGDFAPDDPQHWRERLLSDSCLDPTPSPGALSVWARGASTMVKFLASHEALDPARIALVGHSRVGKSVLWAAANDPRIWLVVANQSGELGAAISRRNFGETLGAITDRYGYWFTPKARFFDQRENELPTDQHQLLALIAPRRLLISSASNDLWSDPTGERISATLARDAWSLFESARNHPAPAVTHRSFLSDRIAHRERPGNHGVTFSDWDAFLSFATVNLPPSNKIRFVSYNTGHLRGFPAEPKERAASIATDLGAEVARLDGTVIGLQELPLDPDILQKFRRALGSGWSLCLAPASPKAKHLTGLAYKHSVVRVVSHPSIPEGPDAPPHGAAFHILVGEAEWLVQTGKLHPGRSRSDVLQRDREAAFIANWTPKSPNPPVSNSILLADLNDSYEGSDFAAFGKYGWNDGMLMGGSTLPTKTDAPGRFPSRRLDHVLVHSTTQAWIHSSRVAEERRFSFSSNTGEPILSDHCPVIIDLVPAPALVTDEPPADDCGKATDADAVPTPQKKESNPP
jgi:hypothetical protein